MFGPAPYRIRFRPDSRPRGWELVDGKTFLLAVSIQGSPHLIPQDPEWPFGAPERIEGEDAEREPVVWPPKP